MTDPKEATHSWSQGRAIFYIGPGHLGTLFLARRLAPLPQAQLHDTGHRQVLGQHGLGWVPLDAAEQGLPSVEGHEGLCDTPTC